MFLYFDFLPFPSSPPPLKPVGTSPSDLIDEAILLKSLQHPNIIQFIDIFSDANNLYLIMELVSGGDLFDRIVEKGRYEEDEARELTYAMCSALKYLHVDKKVMHRDLKPENILLANRFSGLFEGCSDSFFP